MPYLQVRNVPEDLHARLRRRAREEGCAMSSIVLAGLERELTRREWRGRLVRRAKVDLGIPAADLLARERHGRDQG